MMSNSSHSIVCKEIFDKTEPPSDEEIKEYALKIGIHIEQEPHLLPLAIDGLTRPLPAHWQPCYHVETKNWYYFNFKTKETIWEHPYDDLYRNVVIKARYLAQNNPEDAATLDLCKPLTPDFEPLEEEILVIVTEEMLPNKGFNLSNNPLFYSSSGALGRKPTLTPIEKDRKKKQIKSEAFKSSLKPSNPINQKSPVSPVSNSQLKDRSLNTSSVISTSGFSSLDSKQRFDLSLYDHLNEYDDDYISSLASERRTSNSEQLRKTSKTDSRKGTVRFHLSDKDGVNEDETHNKISIDDVASLGLSTDSGVVSSVNQAKIKAKSTFTLMGGGSAFLKKSGKKSDGKDDVDTEGDKRLSDSGDALDNSLTISDRKKKLISSKSVSAQNLSEFSSRRQRPLMRSSTTDAQDCDTLVGDMNDDLLNDNNDRLSHGPNDRSGEDDDYSADERNVNCFLKKNRSNLLMNDAVDRSQKLSTNETDNLLNLHQGSSVKSLTKPPDAPKKVLNIRFGLNELDSLSSSASNAINSQEISEEESAKLVVAPETGKEPSRNLTSNFRRTSLLSKEKFIDESFGEDSLKSDSSLGSKNLQVGNFKGGALQKTQVEQNDFKKGTVKSTQEDVGSVAGSKLFSHLQGPSGTNFEDGKETKSHVARVLERVQGLGNDEETESTKRTAELVNRLEKSIEDKLKSKKEKTQELDRSLSELDEKLSKLNKYREEEVEKQSQSMEKTLAELTSEFDVRIQQLKISKQRELDQVKMKGEKEIELLKMQMNVEKEVLEKTLEDMEASYNEKLNKVRREGDEQVTTIKEKLTQELVELRQGNKDALMIVKHENQSCMDEIFEQHKTHVQRLQDMFTKEEALLEMKHKEKVEALEGMIYKVDKDCLDFAQLSREYEKLRCKYRILEDKYNGLKEKFLQMRNDIRLSVERKRQAKATAKFQQQYRQKTKETSGEDTDISIIQTRSLTDRPRKKRLDLFPDSDSKGDTTSTSLSIPSKFLSNKETNFRPFKNDEPNFTLQSSGVKNNGLKLNPKELLNDSVNGSGRKVNLDFELSSHEPMNNPKECLRKQLDKLEEIDSELPPTSHADSYLRYPFIEIDSKLNDQLDAEIEFYRHRLLLEYDNVVRAKEKLREDEQKVARSKHSVPNTQLSTLQRVQLEDELTALEASVERTRALLTEKFKRLRLMHQTLDAALNIPLDQSMVITSLESSPSSPPAKPELQLAEPPVLKAEKPPIPPNKPQTIPHQPIPTKASPSSEAQEQPSKSDGIHEKISELKDWLKKVSASSK